MDPIDLYLPQHQFAERHALTMDAQARQVLDAVERLDFSSDPVFRIMMGIREAPTRLAARLGLRPKAVQRPTFGLHEFTRLGRVDDTFLGYGLVGRFWRPGLALEAIRDADAFRTFDRPGIAKLLLGFRCRPQTGGGCLLETETRVYCPDRRSLLLFAPYWLAIRPASGLLRHRTLRAIKIGTATHPSLPGAN